MLNNERTSAIVVTFHPRAEYVKNIAKMRTEVDLLIVVDNGSNGAELEPLRQLSIQDHAFRLTEIGRNVGIAAALNLGIREAQKEDCKWVALFDQDSEVTDGFISTMIEEFAGFREERKIMQIIPRYLDPQTGLEHPVSRYADGGVFLTITSGSVFAMEAFETFGLFREDLFIYCVDDDYSLRIRKGGYFIGQSKNAVLLHQSGNPTSRKLLGRTVSTKNYRPEARYYYARNKVWILRVYGLRFPRLVLPILREFVSIPLKIALMESKPTEKIKMFVRGLADGVAGRMGSLRQPEGAH